MTAITSSNYRNPVSGKITAGQQRPMVVRGTGFGTGPTKAFFDRIRGDHMSRNTQTSPDIGEWHEVDSGSKIIVQGGEGFLPFRRPDAVASNSQELATCSILPASSYSEFFFSFRIVAQTGMVFPWCDSAGQEPIFTGSAAKPFWFSNDSNNNDADLMVPNWNASGLVYLGNSNGVSLNSSQELAALNNGNGADIKSNNPTLFGYYQSGDASSNTSFDATVERMRIDRVFGGIASNLANPFYKESGGVVTPPNTKYYQKLFWATWWGLKAGGTWANQQCLINNIVLQTGTNARARVILTNAPTIAASTNGYIVPDDDWSDTEIIISPTSFESLGYAHVVNGSGTLQQNVEMSWL